MQCLGVRVGEAEAEAEEEGEGITVKFLLFIA